MEAGCAAGFSTELITVEIGSRLRGMVDDSTFVMLRSVLKVPQKDLSSLCMTVIRTTILESYKMWCSITYALDVVLVFFVPLFCLYLFVMLPAFVLLFYLYSFALTTFALFYGARSRSNTVVMCLGLYPWVIFITPHCVVL